jgi:hypothetical protein
MYSTVLVVASPGRAVALLVAPASGLFLLYTLKRHLHALRPRSNKPERCIACMQAQPVRVIVRLPYNRPEDRQSDPVPVSPPDNQLYNQGPTHVLSFFRCHGTRRKRATFGKS